MALKDAGVEVPIAEFPVVVRKGWKEEGKRIWFYLNYSPQEYPAVYEGGDAEDLFTGEKIRGGDTVTVKGWDLKILEETLL